MSFGNWYVDCLARLCAAFVCGLVLGVERKRRYHSVGMRTLILICVSSAVMCMLSVLIAEKSVVKGDPTRIAAGVVTGIGFVGGGAIIHQGLNIRGLTTAAVIWTACALGLACGVGEFFVVAVTLAVSVLSLIFLGFAEMKLFPAEKTKRLTLTYASDTMDLKKIRAIISSAGFIFRDLNMSESLELKRTTLVFSVKAPENFELHDLVKKLREVGQLVDISISDD